MRTIKKEVKVVTDWHGVLKEINKIGVFGAKKVQSINITPYHSDLKSAKHQHNSLPFRFKG